MRARGWMNASAVTPPYQLGLARLGPFPLLAPGRLRPRTGSGHVPVRRWRRRQALGSARGWMETPWPEWRLRSVDSSRCGRADGRTREEKGRGMMRVMKAGSGGLIPHQAAVGSL